jgi:GT2 family glycosyltransferase
MTTQTTPPLTSAEPRSRSVLPKLTIDILAFNRRDDVRITLRKVFEELDYPLDRVEVIVVDNASSDGTKEMVASEFPAVRLIVNEINSGIAGWNRGFEAATGDYVLVLDDDSAPESGLRAAIEYLESNPAVGVLACKIVGGAFTTERLHDGEDTVGFIGCGAIIRCNVLETVGGFAEWLFIYAHEWEYAIRCLDRGFAIRYFERCVVHHRASVVNRSNARLRSFSTRNELLIVHRYFRRSRLLYLFRTFVHHLKSVRSEGVRSLFYTFKGLSMFLREAGRHPRAYVSDAVQDVYSRDFWSTQPIVLHLFRKVGRRLGFSHV